ncbi:elongator complex protein 4 [Anopheles aquasalis]|uniref:elongator complex protein 4 n=1 Tax=Anopheles aquasalis TaxID=42839 RepID=UPI00215A4AAE|nr:elongator complex protein 4 [Anopheles aquasalis]
MSGFVKRRRGITIKGARLSLHSGQSIVSSGNPSLDHIFGGGFPVGSIIGLEEDKYGNYARVLAKYFLAEGVVNDHALLLASLEEDPDQLMRKLPTPVEEKSRSSKAVPPPSADGMRIAFRYNQLTPVDSEQKSSQSLGHYFDLTKAIDPTTLLGKDITYWSGSEVAMEQDEPTTTTSGPFESSYFASLLSCIHRKAREQQFTLNATDDTNKNVLRICLHSVGSPVWYDRGFSKDFVHFLTVLKAIVRNTLSVCFITMPYHLFHHLEDSHLCAKLTNLCDYSFGLEAFVGQAEEQANPLFKEYHGLLNIGKITALNSLAPFTPETRDLAFKLKRSKFVIEKLHLPPDLAAEDGQSSSTIVPTMSCSGGGVKSKLDF